MAPFPSSAQKSYDLIKKGETLFLEVFEMRVVHRFYILLAPMDFPIDAVVRVAELRKMRVRRFEAVNEVRMLRKLFCDIVRRMRHVVVPRFLLQYVGNFPTVRDAGR